jgi:ribosomal 50S subunit-recycling heat shock protein
VTINGKPAKPSATVHVNDVLVITIGKHPPMRVKVLVVPVTKSVSPALVSTLYLDLSTLTPEATPYDPTDP